jgi:hypothetical protein
MRQTDRKCFTIIHCSLHNKCALARADYRNGYFSPRNVGEHCDAFVPAPPIVPTKIIHHNLEADHV